MSTPNIPTEALEFRFSKNDPSRIVRRGIEKPAHLAMFASLFHLIQPTFAIVEIDQKFFTSQHLRLRTMDG